MIAACMGNNVFNKLYKYAWQHTDLGYIRCLDKIAEWTQELYRDYYPKLSNWVKFEDSKHNIYDSLSWDDFVIEWAFNRLKKYKKTGK